MKRGHGFIYNEHVGEVFFPGAAISEDFLGLHDLQKSLRIGDEVSFIAWNQAGSGQGCRMFKAEKVKIPPFCAETGNGNRPISGGRRFFGFVTRIFPGALQALLYCKSLGAVVINIEDVNVREGRCEFELGGRFQFTPKMSEFDMRKPIYCRAQYAAENAEPYEEGLMKIQKTNRGGFDRSLTEQKPVAKVLSLKSREPITDEEMTNGPMNCEDEELDDDWLAEIEKELVGDVEEPINIELPQEEMDRVTLLDRKPQQPIYVETAAQTDSMLAEREIIEELINDESIMNLIVQKYPRFLPSLLFSSRYRTGNGRGFKN